MRHAIFVIPFALGTVSEIHLYVIILGHPAYRAFMDGGFSARCIEGFEMSTSLVSRCGVDNIPPEEEEIIEDRDEGGCLCRQR